MDETEEMIESCRARGLSDYDIAYDVMGAQADAQLVASASAHELALMVPYLVELGLDEDDCLDALNDVVDEAGLGATW